MPPPDGAVFNFWYWIIQSFGDVIVGALIGSGILPPHQQWGIALAVVGYGTELLTVLISFVGSFIRLRTVAFVGGLIIFMEIWRNKGKILNIIAIVRFFL